MYLSILAVVLLLAANAFFVAAEFALVKVRVDPASRPWPRPAAGRRALPTGSSSIWRPISPPASSASPWRRWAWAGSASRPWPPCWSRCSARWAWASSCCTPCRSLLGFLLFSSLHIVHRRAGAQDVRDPPARADLASGSRRRCTRFFLLCWPLNWALNTASRGHPPPARAWPRPATARSFPGPSCAS